MLVKKQSACRCALERTGPKDWAVGPRVISLGNHSPEQVQVWALGAPTLPQLADQPWTHWGVTAQNV